MEEIELGDTVKNIYSNFKGVVVAKVEYINGCKQYGIVPKWDGKSPSVEDIYIDEQSLVIVKKKIKPKPERYTGGPSNHITRRNY